MGKERDNKHYKAFISYSDDDEASSSWLDKALENKGRNY
ncbi:MAG: Unknown protein [uncultured Sulfurovum sp.]|uniref:TIR domain-containing protein n=1 Tax=uncultured Sulfurovum sp. TaxID=269237 RepID=A0A6S6TLT6_9BACT|nr:MAG: Unknown protein [uncultured Sulfurovum sp.]